MNLAEKLVMRPIGALVPYASNSRTHTPEQKISKIARNVEAFGFTNRILGPRSVCVRLYVVRSAPGLRRRDGFAETAFAETARFIKVSALIR